MDEYWRAAVAFANRFASKGIVAPVEMAELLPVHVGYANARPEHATSMQTLVLHKGNYRNLDPTYLSTVLRCRRPSYANPVFIVLTEEVDPLPASEEHIGMLPEIISWALEAAEADAKPLAHGPRMAPVYVGGEMVLVETIRHHMMFVPGTDRSISPHLIRSGYFEEPLIRYIESVLRPGMIFVDIGANIGFFTLIAAASVGKLGIVVAMEASPRLTSILQDNLQMNGYEKSSLVLPFAAAETDGELTLYEAARYQGGNTLVPGIARTMEDTLHEQTKPVTVKARALTSLLAENFVGKVDLIKIDVEGYELEVLAGAAEFLRMQPRLRMIVEWQKPFLKRNGREEKLYRMLTQKLGCSLFVIGPSGETHPVTAAELAVIESADIVAERGFNSKDSNQDSRRQDIQTL